MTKFEFESNDGSEWTEEEKIRAIARNQTMEKLANERFRKAREELLMKLIFKSNDDGAPLLGDK